MKDAKNGLSSDKGQFGNRTQAFKDGINEFLQGKKDMYENVGDLMKSDMWKMAVNGNSAAADASAVFAATLLTRHDRFSSKLTNLESDIRGNSAERVRELGKADQKIDEFHQKKTQQITTMTKKFGDQHAERSGRLTKIDNRVQGLNTKAKAGFQDVQKKLDGLQGKLGGVIDGVAELIKNDAALTTRELKDTLAKSFEYTRNKIGVIDEKVTRNGEMIQVALDNTKTLLHDGFDKTNRVLVASSERMSAVMASSFQVLRNTVVDAAQHTQDVVSSRVIANGAKLSEQLVEFNYKLEYVEGRLVVLADQVSTLDERLQVTNMIMQDLAASAELVAVGLESLVGDIKEILFQQAFEDLRDRYSSLRYNYQNSLASPEDFEMMNALKQSCQQTQAHDLLLSFLNLVDIEDEQIPKQMEYFKFEPQRYEAFGMQVITALDELSLLSTLCSGLLFRDDVTEEDLRRKSRENARLIRHAARQFTRHTSEVIPAYLISVRVRRELEDASKMELGGSDAMRNKTVAEVKDRLQQIVGTFARVTVLVAPQGGTLAAQHLEEQYPAVDLSNVRRYGMMLSANKVMAVFWGNTKQLPATEPLNKDELLRQGIFRGTVSTGAGCIVAQDNQFYPRCINCVCEHFEDFASNTSATAGRVVTIYNSTAIDSGFFITSVKEAHVDYFIDQIRLQVALDVPALGAISTTVLDQRRAPQQQMLWEGYADNGKFDVVPGDVKGTLLPANELTLTLNYGGNAFRQIVRLFCNGRPLVVDYKRAAEKFPVQLTYQCREIIRTAVDPSSDAVLVRGQPTDRMDVAVCLDMADGSTNCRVTGGFDTIEGSIKAIRIGRYERSS
ncbi:hypothetical protein P43SY_011403 [Pythium insidiosum]|uniref:Uncharacterized protein n=1 Tax=Pythium insidiosum TaxID=114742 RepID=A0AAD5Q1J0_PYTIN|nr:hypothetical protein P43SY_011403 [Pythium insidiosum]